MKRDLKRVYYDNYATEYNSSLDHRNIVFAIYVKNLNILSILP